MSVVMIYKDGTI